MYSMQIIPIIKFITDSKKLFIMSPKGKMARHDT